MIRAAALALLLPAAALAQPLGPPEGEWREQLHAIAAPDGVVLQARLCRPPGRDDAPLALLLHREEQRGPLGGRRAPPAPGSVALQCWSNEAQFFLARGHAVLAPLRRGHAPSGGRQPSGPGCAEQRAAEEGRAEAADMEAVLAYAAGLEGVAPTGAVVFGEGRGGWVALTLLAKAPPGVVAGVVAGPVWGGASAGNPATACDPAALRGAAAGLGAATRLPTLWLTAATDRALPPALAAPLFAAYAGAGTPAQRVELAGAPQGAVPGEYQLLDRLEGRPLPAGTAATRLLDAIR